MAEGIEEREMFRKKIVQSERHILVPIPLRTHRIAMLWAAIVKYPKTILFSCYLLMLFSWAEIHFAGKYGYSSPHEGFAIDFRTLWINRPNSAIVREDENNQPLTYCYNREGFRRRDPSDSILREKKKEIRRIIVMGDSTANGHAVPFDCMYAEILDRMFGEKVEVFSSGVPGFTAVQCRLQLQHKILAYKPDLITVSVNYNDRRSIADCRQVDSEEYFYYNSRLRWVTEGLSHHFACFNALIQHRIETLQRKIQQNPPRLDQLTCRVPLPVFMENLGQICDIAKENHIGLLLIGQGDSFQYFERIYDYQKAETYEKKVSLLERERDQKKFYSFGLATLLLADLLKREGIGDTGLDIDRLLTSYFPAVSAIGGFLIAPDWIYREAIQQVAAAKQVPYFDFVDYARACEDIDRGDTPIFVKNDPVHLNIQGHQLLAEALFPILEEMLFSRGKNSMHTAVSIE